MAHPNIMGESALDPQPPPTADAWMRADQARLLRCILPWLGGSLGVGLVVTLAAIAGNPTAWQLGVLGLLLAASIGACALAGWLNRRWRGQVGNIVLILSLIAVALALGMLLVNLIVVMAILALLLALLAGVLISPRAGYGVAFSLMALGAALVILDETGLYAPTLNLGTQITAYTDLLVFLGTILMATYLVSLNQTSTRRAIQQFMDQSRLLEEQQLVLTARTQDLERRATLLATAADVSRATASILDPAQLTRQVVNLVRERFNLYYVGLFLLDDAGAYAVLEAGTGEPGRVMREQGHRLAVGGQSMVGMACATRQARIVLDVGQEPIRFNNPLLPLTQSEIALPLLVGDRVLGALDVQSTRPAAFSQEDMAVLQLVADQVAVAVENAHKFSHEGSVLEATSPIYRASRRLTTATTRHQVASAIIESVIETGADGCVVIEFEFTPANEPVALHYLGVWRRDRAPQFQPGLRLPIAESPFPLEMVNTLWTVPDVEQDTTLPASARQVFVNTEARALTNIPLHSGQRVSGQVVVLRSTPGPFSESALRLYETLSDQAAMALERARLLEATRRRAEEEATLRGISDRMALALDMETVLRQAAAGLSEAFTLDGVYIELEPAPTATAAPNDRVSK